MTDPFAGPPLVIDEVWAGRPQDEPPTEVVRALLATIISRGRSPRLYFIDQKATNVTLPVDPALGHLRPRAEREALARAREWAARDPFYEGQPITRREEALMMLALRALTMPTETDIGLLGLPEAPPKPRPAPIASIGCPHCGSYDHTEHDHTTTPHHTPEQEPPHA